MTPDPYYSSLHCRRRHAADTRHLKPRAAPLRRRCDRTPPPAAADAHPPKMASQQQVPQGQPLELAPRGNMALTLADSFLNDLDELEEDNDEEEQEEVNEELANDLEESDDDVMAELKDEGVDAKIKLQSSERYRRHMSAIAERSEKPASFDDDEEYALIVESNEILVKMDAELHEVHAYVNDLYGKKFPELETLVPSKLEYLRVVAQMRNEMDMTQVAVREEIKFWAPYAIDATSTSVVSTRRGRGWSFS